MVVVMPAPAEHDQSDKPVIAALIASIKAPTAEAMRQRIDAKRGMKRQYGSAAIHDKQTGQAP